MEDDHVLRYLTQVRLTPPALAAFMKEPTDRGEALRPLIERSGGKLIEYYLPPEDCTAYVIIEAPAADGNDAATLAIAAGGAGELITWQISRILTSAELVDTMKEAAAIAYAPPS